MALIAHLVDHVSLLIILLITFVSLSKCNPLITKGVTIDLIHADLSSTSPLYDPSLSHYQRVANAFHRSSPLINHPADANVAPAIQNSNGIYLMQYVIGTVQTTGGISTGSDLIWTPCSTRLRSSKSLKNLNCNTHLCTSFPGKTCRGNTLVCTYSTTYGDGSSSQGTISNDTITLGGIPFTNIAYGCDDNTSEKDTAVGLVGLGRGPLSLVRQLGSGSFGFWLAPFGGGTSKLHLGGSAAGVSGNNVVVVPLVQDSQMPSFYKVVVQNINIAVGSDKKTVVTLGGNGNMVVDTGTTKTLFPGYFYNKFLAAVNASMQSTGGKVTAVPQGLPSDLCYSILPSKNKFPVIKVGFGNGASVVWKQENLFLQFNQKLWCLAAGISNIKDSIYGSTAMINFNVGLDLNKNTATFRPT